MKSDRKLTVEDRLYADEVRPDRTPHLRVEEPSRCLECTGRECTVVCPASTYRWEDDGRKITVSYENCLECGTCRVACPHANISWRYPMGGMGICYRYG